jgi:hypothetical protein
MNQNSFNSKIMENMEGFTMSTTTWNSLKYFVPSSPYSLLAKLQKKGFLLRSKLAIIRDFILLNFLFLGIFYWCSLKQEQFMHITIYLLSISALYILGFIIFTGKWKDIIAIIILLPILAALTAIFPPIGILAAIIAIGLFIRKIINLLLLIPWAILSFIFYALIGVATGSSEVINNIPLFVNHTVSVNSSFFQEFLPLFIGFSVIISAWCSTRYRLMYSLFRISVMFVVVPLILILIFLFNTDSDADTGDFGDMQFGDWDLNDGSMVYDNTGLRIDFPDDTFARYIESSNVAGHFRYYA